MQERRVKQEFWIKGKLVVVEGVPAGICPQCGEKVVKADVGRSIAVLVSSSKRLRKARTMSVPVIRYAREVA
jgi:YgiT-type zinc finger domain-containing protein